MPDFRSVKPLLLLIAVGVFSRDCLAVQGRVSSPASPSTLQMFFKSLVENHNRTALPSFDDLLAVEDRVPAMRTEDITKALPTIMKALAHRDINVELYATSALISISRRQDSALLLKNYLRLIGQLSASPDPRLQASMGAIIFGLQPEPPPEAIPILVIFLRRTDRNVKSQAGAVSVLLHIAPEKPEVLAEIKSFVSRPMGNDDKIAILNALGNSGHDVKDHDLIQTVIHSLGDGDQGVRFTAIQVIARMGRPALSEGVVKLQEIAKDPTQPINVRTAAQDALHRLQGQPD